MMNDIHEFSLMCSRGFASIPNSFAWYEYASSRNREEVQRSREYPSKPCMTDTISDCSTCHSRDFIRAALQESGGITPGPLDIRQPDTCPAA